MKLAVRVKEKIARTIGDHFTTNEIVSVFADAGVEADRALYAKWRIALDGFSKFSDPDKYLPQVLEEFCHPLNFEDPQVRMSFIEKLNQILAFDKIKIQFTDTSAKIVSDEGKPLTPTTDDPNGKTSTDYITEAISFFKNEYNKVRLAGLTYEYPLGDNFILSNFEPESDAINHAYYRKIAVERLKEIGFITSFEIEERVIDDYGYVFDYAICKIDESKLVEQKEAPRATQEKAEDLAEKVIKHEHTHRFENSIQEKDIQINIQDTKKNAKKSGFPFTIQAGTQWENVYIEFKNEEAVRIKVSGHTHDTSFADMGFADKRTGKPNTQWTLLRLFAQNGGSLTAGDPDARDKYKKHKQLLSDTLKTYFSIDYDPFKTYGKTDGYSIKINLSAVEKQPENVKYSNDDEVEEMFQNLAE